MLESVVQGQGGDDGIEPPVHIAEGVELRHVGALVGEVQFRVVFHIGEEELSAGDAGIVVFQGGLPGGVGLDLGQLGVIVGFVGKDHRLVEYADAIRFTIAGGPRLRGVVHPFEEAGFVVIIHSEGLDLHAGSFILRVDSRQNLIAGGEAVAAMGCGDRRVLRCGRVQSVRIFVQVRRGEGVGGDAVHRRRGPAVQDGIVEHIGGGHGGVDGAGQRGGEDAAALLRAVDRGDGAVGQVVDEGHLARLVGVAVNGRPQLFGVLEDGGEGHLFHAPVIGVALAHVDAVVAPVLLPAHPEAGQLRAVGVVKDVEVLGPGLVGAGGEDMGGGVNAVGVRQRDLGAPEALMVGGGGADQGLAVIDAHGLVGLGGAVHIDQIGADAGGQRGDGGAGLFHRGGTHQLFGRTAAAVRYVHEHGHLHIPVQTAGLAIEGVGAGQLNVVTRNIEVIVTRGGHGGLARVVQLSVDHHVLHGGGVAVADIISLVLGI